MPIRLTRALIVAIPLACFGGAAILGAADRAPTPAMMVPVSRIVAFVNSGAQIREGTYSASATITDEFAPFHWTSGDVGRQWSSRFTASNAAAKIARPHIVLGAPTEFVTSATGAYIVFPGRFTPLVNGKPFTETGYWTFVEVKDGAAWRVSSQAWAGVTFK